VSVDTFIALDLFGRVSRHFPRRLAFAVWHIKVSRRIVVSGNVVRRARAASRGTPRPADRRMAARQVAGALFASTATTVECSCQCCFLKDAEGQLFGDLALTI